MANTGRPAPVVCSECGAAAPDDPDPRRCGMPKTWEHYNPEACPECVQTSQRPAAEGSRPVCGDCVGTLLDELLQAMRVAR